MDDTLIGRGLRRAPLPRFLLWLAPWAGLLAFGLHAVYLCFAEGLNQTDMDSRFAFGLWICLDPTVIALGGLYGVLRGDPFAFREHVFIWPTTFFLFVLTAAAVGPSFILLTTRLVGKVSRKRLLSPEVLQTLGKVSGWLLLVDVVLKGIDSLVRIDATSPKTVVQFSSFYAHPPFGTWILFAEVVLLGLVPAVLLPSRRVRARTGLLVLAAATGCAGVVLNRYVMTFRALALPSLPFDSFLSCSPSWRESAAFLAVLGYGVLLYSVSFRWPDLFPEERAPAAKG